MIYNSKDKDKEYKMNNSCSKSTRPIRWWIPFVFVITVLLTPFFVLFIYQDSSDSLMLAHGVADMQTELFRVRKEIHLYEHGERTLDQVRRLLERVKSKKIMLNESRTSYHGLEVSVDSNSLHRPRFELASMALDEVLAQFYKSIDEVALGNSANLHMLESAFEEADWRLEKIENELIRESNSDMGRLFMIVFVFSLVTALAIITVGLVKYRQCMKCFKEMEKKDERHAFLNTLFNNMNDAVYAVDERHFIREVNRAACRELGYERDELVGKHVSVVDVEASRVEKEVFQNRKNNEATQLKTHHRRKDNTVFPVDLSICPFREEDRAWVVAVARNLGDQEEREKKLVRRIEMLTSPKLSEPASSEELFADSELLSFLSAMPFPVVVFREDRNPVPLSIYDDRVADSLLKILFHQISLVKPDKPLQPLSNPETYEMPMDRDSGLAELWFSATMFGSQRLYLTSGPIRLQSDRSEEERIKRFSELLGRDLQESRQVWKTLPEMSEIEVRTRAGMFVCQLQPVIDLAKKNSFQARAYHECQEQIVACKNSQHEMSERLKESDEALQRMVSELRAPVLNIQGFLNLVLEQVDGELSAEAERDVKTLKKELDVFDGYMKRLSAYANVHREERLETRSETLQKLVDEARGRLHREFGLSFASLDIEGGSLVITGDFLKLKKMMLYLLRTVALYSAPPVSVRMIGKECEGGISIEMISETFNLLVEDKERLFDLFYIDRDGRGIDNYFPMVKKILRGMGANVGIIAGREGKGIRIMITLNNGS